MYEEIIVMDTTARMIDARLNKIDLSIKLNKERWEIKYIYFF
jgi:hypothetical protein